MGINVTNSNKANNDLSSQANSLNTNTDTHTHYIRRWNSMSWLSTGTRIWWC